MEKVDTYLNAFIETLELIEKDSKGSMCTYFLSGIADAVLFLQRSLSLNLEVNSETLSKLAQKEAFRLSRYGTEKGARMKGDFAEVLGGVFTYHLLCRLSDEAAGAEVSFEEVEA
jgi:hypothetical protein